MTLRLILDPVTVPALLLVFLLAVPYACLCSRWLGPRR